MATAKPTSRRAAREAALRAIYSSIIGGDEPSKMIDDYAADLSLDAASKGFAKALADAAWDQRKDLERTVEPYLKEGWTLKRIAVVDRAVLALAAAELESFPDISPSVTISEAVRIARKYGSVEGSRFVNGVLGSLLPNTDKANWSPTGDSDPVFEKEESQPEPREEMIEEGTPEHDEVLKASTWVIKSEG
jgi:N utilization substance protein B